VARATDPDYLRYQYGTTDKLDTRIDAHQRFSERPDDYFEWVLAQLDPRPGDLAVDVGCGEDAFVFSSTEAALRYYTSGPVDAINNAPTDASHRPRLETEVGAAIDAIIQREGAFRVPKNGVCFVASA
jgi:hypothetical protein